MRIQFALLCTLIITVTVHSDSRSQSAFADSSGEAKDVRTHIQKQNKLASSNDVGFERSNKVTLKNLLLPQKPAEWVVYITGASVVTGFWASGVRFRVLPWQQDKWSSSNGSFLSQYDKLEHFGFAATGQALMIGLDRSGLVHSTAFRRIKLSLMLISWWELKDSVVYWEQYGHWGGEGFSFKDWFAGAGGIIGTELLNFALGKF